jgi:opacity protein-like surface antigen
VQSSRSRLMVAALFGVLALGAFTAAAAQAVEAPRWSITGTILTAGKTHFITAKAYSTTLTLTSLGGNKISCTGLNLKAGSLLGSSAGNAGKNNEAIEFTGCRVEGPGIFKCIIESPKSGIILTNPIRSELVETEKAEPANKKGSLLTLFEPEVGTVFATLKFKGENGRSMPTGSTFNG